MAKLPVSKRTYFAHPMIDETLMFFPKALELKESQSFRTFLIENLHYNSQNCRRHYSNYIIHRFSRDGIMDQSLARAIAKFGNSNVGREILYYELLQAEPVLQEWAVLWLSELSQEGVSRASFVDFLQPRLNGRNPKVLVEQGLGAFRKLGKIRSPKPGVYLPIWAEPPLEAFLYVLAKVLPDLTMMQVDHFAAFSIFRALLWPRQAIVHLIYEAERAGHISKISDLDQYHQFTTSGTMEERLEKLFEEC